MQQDDPNPYRDSNRATAWFALWTLAWVVTLAAARFGPELAWDRHPAASWVAVAVNVLVGVGWLLAFVRYLRALDDLWRRIVQDALAAALGVGWVAGFGYLVADAAGLLAEGLPVALLPALLGGVYVVAVVVGRLRYR